MEIIDPKFVVLSVLSFIACWLASSYGWCILWVVIGTIFLGLIFFGLTALVALIALLILGKVIGRVRRDAPRPVPLRARPRRSRPRFCACISTMTRGRWTAPCFKDGTGDARFAIWDSRTSWHCSMSAAPTGSP